MKRLSLVLATCAIAVLPLMAHAQNTWSFELRETATSRYVGGTAGALFSDKPCIQLSLYGFHPSGFYAGIWQSLPFQDRYRNTFAREFDYGAGYSRDIAKGWNADVSFTVYDLVPTTDLYALAITLSATSGPVRPYLMLEHDFAESAQLPSGTVYKVGLRGEVPKTALQWDAAFMGNYSPDRRPYGGRQDTVSAVSLKLGYPFKFGPGVVTPYVVSQNRVGRDPSNGGIAGNQIIWGASYSVRF